MRAAAITLLTDFGTEDAFVGIMKGVILGINPKVRLVDLTHAVPPQQIMTAALALRSAVRFFAADTIHLVVVDPGVGSERRPILIETEGGILVGPDNGVLTPAADLLRRRAARVIENAKYFRQPVSQTFHGRDIFAPVAAHLSLGARPASLGPALDAITELDLPASGRTETAITGEVLYVDRFGNLITNIGEELLSGFPSRELSVSINRRPIAGPVDAYSAVPEGTPLAIIGSWGALEIAVRNGNAAKTLAAGPGTPVTVVLE